MVNKNTYNASRDALLIEHIKAMEALSAIYEKKVANFLLPLNSIPTDKVKEYVTGSFPAFNKPFQITAGMLGQGMYINRRQQASNINKNVPNFSYDFREMKDIDGYLNTFNPVGVLSGTLINLKQGKLTPNNVVGLISNITSNSVTNVSRDIIKLASAQDSFSVGEPTRRAKSDACSFCKLVIVSNGGRGKYHDHCNCTIDTSFKGEPEFEQAWEAEAHKEVEKAFEIIRNGNAGKRTVQIATREWNSINTRELFTKAKRTIPNNSHARSQARRDIADFVKKVGNKGDISNEDVEMLHKHGIVSSMEPDIINEYINNLRQPLRPNIATLSSKNVTAVMNRLASNKN